ncbi:MAG: tetratricopeptide repeat protein [Bacteroidales bacterium]|nr:tetratricopeptide repeat protein [Bacteroidales bacterium]
MKNMIQNTGTAYLMKSFIIVIFFVFSFGQSQLKGQNESSLLFENISETVDDYLFLSKTFLGRSVDKSNEYSLNALKNAKLSGQDSLMAKSYKSCGVVAFYARRFNDAIAYYDSANIYFRKMDNIQEIANNFNNIGLAHSRMKDHLKAIDNLNIALEMNMQLQNAQNTGLIINNIGALYYELKAYKKANEYFEEGYNLAKLHNNKQAMLTARNNMGMAENIFNNNDKALVIFKECILIAKEIKNDIGLADSYLNTGNTYIRKSMPDSAAFYLTNALHYYQISDRPVGRVLLAMGRANKLKGNNKEALRLFQQALISEQQKPDPDLILPALKEIYPLLEQNGKISEAYAALKQYHLIFDTLKSLYDSTAVANLQARFELENKIKEVNLLQTEVSDQKQKIDNLLKKNKLNNILVYAFLLVIIILLYFSVRYFRLYTGIRKSFLKLAEENNLHVEARSALSESLNFLTQKEALLRSIINNSPDIICYKDGNGRWLEANDAMLELFDLTGKEYKLQTDKSLASYSIAFADHFKTIIVADELCWQKATATREEEKITNKSGSKVIFDIIKIPLFKEDGSRKGLIILGRDITSKKVNDEKSDL